MPKEFNRTDRVADFLQRELAQLIQFQVRDPRVGMASIRDVEVTRDLAYAKVFVTFVGKETDKECEEAAEVLNGATGFLRTQVAKMSNMRSVPKLRFIYDKSVREGTRLSAIIEQAVQEDRDRAGDQDESEN